MRRRVASTDVAVAVPIASANGEHAQSTPNPNRDDNGVGTGNVLTQGMGGRQQRYSALGQIHENTVKRLVPGWRVSLDNDGGEQAEPFVHIGVISA